MEEFLIGVDEAGRGPLAGPVAVGIVAVPMDFDIAQEFPGVDDSKKLSEKRREALFERALLYKERGEIRFSVQFASAGTIDTLGITHAVRQCVYKGIEALAPNPLGVEVRLDGLLHAPEGYKQQTIIKGDATEPVISLASVLAKVSRDRLMCALAEQFPGYGFEIHKGYGTRAHKDAIASLGLSSEHRRSFCH